MRPRTHGQDETDPCWWPATQVAAAIAARHISAREYLQAQQARVARYNGALNAVVTIDERAWEHAREADQAVTRGAELGPLHGVAITVKDCLATRGLRTTGGLTMLKSYLPREDASVVARLRAAGAIVFGKTNLPDGSADVQSFNDLFGVTANPWHRDYSPGGSSGGPAAAVAAGLSPLEVGSDIAGSVRIPAANCGVFGHKPSYGIVPMRGHIPPAPFAAADLDISVIGPIARDVADLETALQIMAGPDPRDAPGWRLSLPPARPVTRVATWFDDPYCQVDHEVVAALEEAAEHLSGLGVSVCRARPAGVRLDASDAVFRRLLAAVAVPTHTRESVQEIAAGRAAANPNLGAEFVAQCYWDWAEAADKRARMRDRWRQFFTSYDAILLPVTASLAIPHDSRPMAERRITVNGAERPYWDQITWPGLPGVSYLPCTVVPVRLDSRGVPIAIAVAADYLQDRTALATARMLADAIPAIGHPDMSQWETNSGHKRCARSKSSA